MNLLPLPLRFVLALLQSAPAPADTTEASAAAAVRLDRLTVVGSAERADLIAGSAHFLDSGDLERFQHTDINRALREVPGVYVVEEDGYGRFPSIGIRGSGTDRNSRISVMEDGVLIAPAPYAAPAAYHFPTTARINTIEVRKGTASVKAGPRTTGGAVNLISTAIPSRTAGLIDLAIGADNTLLTHGWFGTSGHHGGVLVEGVRQHTDGFKALDGGGNTGFRLDDVVVKGRLHTDAHADRYHSLEFKYGRASGNADETYLGLTDDDFADNPRRRYAASALDNVSTEHRQASLRYLIALSDRADLTTVAYRTTFERNWYKLNDVQGTGISTILANPGDNALAMSWLRGETDSPDDALRLRNNRRSYEALGVQSVVGLRVGGSGVHHDLELSLRYHRDEEDRFQDDDRYRMQDSRLVLTSNGVPGTQDNRIGEAAAWSLYLQDEIIVGRWRLAPGLRYERVALTRIDYERVPDGRNLPPAQIREHTVDQVIPGFGAAHVASDAWTVFAGVHRGFNPPSPGSESQPERSVNTEVGARYHRGRLSGDVVGFWNEYSNLVGTVTASTGGNQDIGAQFDGGEARMRGLEAMLSYELAAGSVALPVALNYTYTRAEFLNAFASGFAEWGAVEPGYRLPYLPEHLLRVRGGLTHRQWRLDLSATYVAAMRTRAGSGEPDRGERTDAALILDLAAGWTVAAETELFMRVRNLTDETYVSSRRPAGLRPGQPRTTLAGIRYRF
ncbi:MAG: TonB-dependent receptor [Candidatus Krumholzibacteria bacterium]|jgi:Fe(3+) dicitrate transport protein|nr:TonB-dependent receptor [Candidatus Krumholzibacteria bacterium]